MLNSNELINKVKVYNKFLNHERLDKAYNFAIKAHQNQKRASGDPYSVHPIEVANILTELKLDSATILPDYYMIQLKILLLRMRQSKMNLDLR